MKIINGTVFRNGELSVGDVQIEGDRFAAFCDILPSSPDDTIILDATGKYVIPGLIDMHFHGCLGSDFCDGTPEALDTITRYEAQAGVTAICPATMTYPEEKLTAIARAASAYEAPCDGAALVGINMEGPFISPDKVGAQNPAYIQAANAAMFHRLQSEAGGLIKLIDIAPEEPGALDFIEAVHNEARISLAHTCATYEVATEAFERGARQLTHLYNAMPPLSHRAPGPIAAAFDRSDVIVEVIADGIHIHPAMVRVAFALFGDDRVALVSDSMMAAGLTEGNYELGGQAVMVVGKRATLIDGTIAGSVADLGSCLRIAVRDMDIPLASAIKAATINPARALGIENERGSIEPGKIADALILNEDLTIAHVIVRGNLLDGVTKP